MTVGLFIGRFQPLHKGHVEVMKTIAETLDKLVIAIGSSNKSNTQENPFTADEREMMIKLSLNVKNYELVKIPDFDDYPKWVNYVIQNSPHFDVVFSGNAVVKKLFEEKGYSVQNIPVSAYVSASQIRQMIFDNADYKHYLPEGTLQILKEMKGVEKIKKIYNKAIYKNPPTAVDVVMEYYNPDFKGIILIKRGNEPFKGKWALPGGFQEEGHSFEYTAKKEMREETNLEIEILHNLTPRSQPNRDPRCHVNSIPFVAKASGELKAGDDAAETGIFKLDNLPDLAFDHAEIIKEYDAWKKFKSNQNILF
jgi:nicotinamide-nucleotide adenylyltransferase